MACGLFLAVRSSFVDHPLAGFPGTGKGCGTALVIVHRDPTGLDELAYRKSSWATWTMKQRR